MSGFNIFQHTHISLNLWWYDKKYIDAYRAQQQGYGHPLTIIMSRKVRKEAKPHGENPPSRKEKAQKFLNNMSSTYPYLHLNDLSELLLDGRLVE